jgi:hypothetical protein
MPCYLASPSFGEWAARPLADLVADETLTRAPFDSDVEMQNFLANPEFLVESDGRIVTVVGLNVNNPATTPCGDLTQRSDQGGGDALPSMLCTDGEIIDVKLSPIALELLEFVGDQPT